MNKLSLKIALPIILAGMFIITIFVALDYEKLELSFYIVFLLLAIYIFFFGFLTGQRFSSPVKKLIQRATDLVEGDLSARVYLENNKDEFGQLAQIFNRIAEDLEKSRNENVQTEKSVDLKVKAKTQALEEIINALEQKVKNRSFELEKIIGESEKLQNQAETREAEVSGLRRELNDLKARLGKHDLSDKN